MKLGIIAAKDINHIDWLVYLINSIPMSAQVVCTTQRSIREIVENTLRSRQGMMPPAKIPMPSGEHDREIYKQYLQERNESLVAASDYIVVFHDGDDRGCREIIEIAAKRGVPVSVIGDGVREDKARNCIDWIAAMLEPAKTAGVF